MAEKRKKLVGMLLHAYYLRDARVQREAECLAEAGYDVHVVSCKQSPQDPPYEMVKGVHIYRVPLVKKRGGKIRYIFEYTALAVLGLLKLARLHLRNRFDVVHIHNMPDFLVIAGMIPRCNGAELVLDIHDPMSELFQETYHLEESRLFIAALRVQESVSYRLAPRLVTVSLPMAENVARKRGCESGAIRVIHNYPDMGKFPIRQDRGKWPYSKEGLVFLYSGTVTEHYRLDIAVRAIAEVSRTIPGVRLLILGDGNRLREVLALAEELGIGDRVEHLKAVKQEHVKDVMAAADVGISTHQGGPFGDLYFSNKILEFMTQGLPAISSRTYTVERYIPEDVIFYFEPERVDDLADKIIRMHNDPDAVVDKIRRARTFVRGYTWQKEKDKLLSFYDELMTRNGRYPNNEKESRTRGADGTGNGR